VHYLESTVGRGLILEYSASLNYTPPKCVNVVNHTMTWLKEQQQHNVQSSVVTGDEGSVSTSSGVNENLITLFVKLKAYLSLKRFYKQFTDYTIYLFCACVLQIF